MMQLYTMFRVHSRLILGVMFIHGGCSTTTMDTSTRLSACEEAQPLSLGNRKVVWTTANQHCTGDKCFWVLNDTAPSADAPSYTKYQCVQEVLQARISNPLTELSSVDLKLSDEEKLAPELVCSRLEELGHHGLLLVTSIASREGFTIGFSSGYIEIRVEVWDISSQELAFSQKESVTRTVPILWVMNYHELLEGRLNRIGRRDMKYLFECLLEVVANSLKNEDIARMTKIGHSYEMTLVSSHRH